MKIAIFHQALDNIGGAEKLVLTLAKGLDADIYTTNIDHDKIKKMGFESNHIYSIGWIPVNAPFRQQMALHHFSRLNLKNKYDNYIIAGDWAVSAAVHHKPNLWYVHSPIREIWDLYEDTRKYSVPKYLRWVFDGWVKYNRFLTKACIDQVDRLVCNSCNTQKRITIYLNRDADIIYPPVDTEKLCYRGTGDFWLSVNRLITHKRIDMQLEAFRALPHEKLVIVGSYEQSKHFKKYASWILENKPDNVTIVSWIDDQKLNELYQDCKGFITTAKDEDFGMTAIEAMAAGKPVIAPNEGGYKESILDGKTGMLIDQINSTKLVNAINLVGQNPSFYKDECLNRAQYFDQKHFVKAVQSILQSNQSNRDLNLETPNPISA